MHNSFVRLLSGFIIACLLFIFIGWSTVSAFSTDAEPQSVILYVKPGANGSCSSWADACSLQTALYNAAAGDQIWVAAGTYKPTNDTNREATFQLKSGVAIYGGFPAAGGGWETREWETNLTTLSGDIGVIGNIGDNSYHVMTGSGVEATAVLDGFIISLGNANGSSPNNRGGGMYNYSGSPTVTNVTLSDNNAEYSGGAMYNYSSNPGLSNVTISSNSATDNGGGMSNWYNSNPSLSNVTFSGNSAGSGGGMLNWDSSPSLRDITFSDNSAGSGGGGMYNYSGSPNLTNVTFSGNSVVYGGGGMYNYESSPSLTNVTFSSNSANYEGGGVYNHRSSPSLTNVTFSDNSADSCGGMCNEGNSNPTLTNAILWGNTPDQISGDSAIVTYSDVQGGYAGVGNINIDPLLGSLADNGGFTQTHAIATSSPAIDAGDPNLCPDFDQRGFPSPIDGDSNGTAVCDMGAYEYGSTIDGFMLTVDVYGNGSVEIVPLKSGYLFGELVTLTATPTIGWKFISWGGDASGSDNPLTYTIIGNTSITTTFTQDEYTLTVTPIGSGTVTVDPIQATYHYGDEVTLTATADPGWTFGGWGGDASGSENPLTYTITGNTTITATFTQDEYTLSFTPIGSGTLDIDPIQDTYHYGDVVTLTATADSSWIFIEWGGDASGSINPLVVTISGNTNITALFTTNWIFLPMITR